ncbi:MAG: protein kinase domain-containing protein [Myxococcota bacterium]
MTEEIGRGGFGMVWKARQLNMDRDVAIKVLPPKFMAIPDVVERFKREARLASRLRHPNTITVHDYGKHENLLFIVMELLEGQDLADLLMSDPKVPVERIVHIAKQVLKSLDEAHSHGIVHRDLKPENIFLTQLGAETDFVKVLDFGIAKLAMPELQGKSEEHLRKLTMSGSTVGTPTYMSPEQAAGESVDAQTDLYALGIIIWELAMGRPPFKDQNPVKVMRNHLFEKIPPFPDKTLENTRFEGIVRRALEKDKEDRYESAMDFFAELDRDLSELMEALVDEPPTVELDPGIGSIDLDPDGQDSEASIAYDRTDSYDAAEGEDKSDSRQSTDGFVAIDDGESDKPDESIPFDSVQSDQRDRVREGASATSSLTDSSALTDGSGLTDTSSLTDRSGLNPAPGGFDQGSTTTSSIITVVEPGPEEDVILLTEPKKSDKKGGAKASAPAADQTPKQSQDAHPDAPVEDSTFDTPTSGQRDANDAAYSTGPRDVIDHDASDDVWEWGEQSGDSEDAIGATNSGGSSTVWIFTLLILLAAAAGAAYLFSSGGI